jgi:hypothetical protein
MRIRTIKPDFWSHPVMSMQSDATRLLAIGLLNLADDEGYFYASPKLVRNALRPMDDDSGITTVSLRELSEIGFISIRKHPTHGEIGFVESFRNHQVINKPKPSNINGLYGYGIDTVSIPDCYGLEGKGKEGRGKEGIPPNPQGGMGDQKPKSKRMTPAQKKITKIKFNTPTMERIGSWFGRRPETLWTVLESELLTALNPTEAETNGMEAFYLAEDPSDDLFRRRDLLTLLNNWPRELDKARGYARRQRGAA